MGEPEPALDPVVLASRMRRVEARVAQLEDWRAQAEKKRTGFSMPYLTPGQKMTIAIVGLFAYSLLATFMTTKIQRAAAS